jgi:hypothetical protein
VGTLARQTADVEREPWTAGSVLGWVLVGVLCLLIVLETLALTVIAVFFSVPLAIAVPLVVAAIGLLIVRDARRSAQR